MSISQQLRDYKVLPVITAHDTEATVALAQALQRGGMRAVEITLRTEAGLASITAVKKAIPELVVAAGTVTNGDELMQAKDAGADFCVSPGISEAVLRSAASQDFALVPGVATASEVMLGKAFGLDLFKLFPAVAVGGLALLKSLAGPFPDIQFCPTGGLNAGNFKDFLELSNVVCVGGSWMVGSELVAKQRWKEIEALAAEAMQ